MDLIRPTFNPIAAFLRSSIAARSVRWDKPHLMITDPPYGVNYDPAWRKRAGVLASIAGPQPAKISKSSSETHGVETDAADSRPQADGRHLCRVFGRTEPRALSRIGRLRIGYGT